MLINLRMLIFKRPLRSLYLKLTNIVKQFPLCVVEKSSYTGWITDMSYKSSCIVSITLRHWENEGWLSHFILFYKIWLWGFRNSLYRTAALLRFYNMSSSWRKTSKKHSSGVNFWRTPESFLEFVTVKQPKNVILSGWYMNGDLTTKLYRTAV